MIHARASRHRPLPADPPDMNPRRGKADGRCPSLSNHQRAAGDDLMSALATGARAWPDRLQSDDNVHHAHYSRGVDIRMLKQEYSI